MRNLSIEDHVIGIAKILKVQEKEVMQVIFDTFKSDSPDINEILDDMYWEFQDDNIPNPQQQINMKNTKFLTDEEKQSIKVLNYIITLDGLIQSEDQIIFLLNKGIEKFIPKRRQHLVHIDKNTYPIKIKY